MESILLHKTSFSRFKNQSKWIPSHLAENNFTENTLTENCFTENNFTENRPDFENTFHRKTFHRNAFHRKWSFSPNFHWKVALRWRSKQERHWIKWKKKLWFPIKHPMQLSHLSSCLKIWKSSPNCPRQSLSLKTSEDGRSPLMMSQSQIGIFGTIARNYSIIQARKHDGNPDCTFKDNPRSIGRVKI